jgi:hypothetical protein
VAVTYNATTTEVWSIPSISWGNRTFTITSYTTIGDIPPVETATIKVIHHYDSTGECIPLNPYDSYYFLSSRTIVGDGWPRSPGSPAAGYGGCPGTSWMRIWFGGNNPEDQPIAIEANIYHVIVHGPQRIVVTGNLYYTNWNLAASCTADYRFTNAVITPTPPDYINYNTAMYAYLTPANYVVERYYEAVSVQCETYEPPNPPSQQPPPWTTVQGPVITSSSQQCTVYEVEEKTQGVKTVMQTVTNPDGSTSVVPSIETYWIIRLVTRLLC